MLNIKTVRPFSLSIIQGFLTHSKGRYTLLNSIFTSKKCWRIHQSPVLFKLIFCKLLVHFPKVTTASSFHLERYSLETKSLTIRRERWTKKDTQKEIHKKFMVKHIYLAFLNIWHNTGQRVWMLTLQPSSVGLKPH